MGLDNPLHIAFLLLIVLLVFGAKRLPELGRSLGSGMRGFRDALSGVELERSLPAAGASLAAADVAPVAVATPIAPVATVASPSVPPVATPSGGGPLAA